MNKSLSIIDLFNLTQPFIFNGYSLINISLVGKLSENHENDINLIKMSSKKNIFKYTGSPIESISHLPNVIDNFGKIRYFPKIGNVLHSSVG